MPPPKGLVKKLEKTGDLVKAPSRKGDSSQLAVLGGHRDVAQILLNRGGAKAGKKDADGQSALTMAMRLNRGLGDAELVGALEFANQTRGAAEVSGLRFN